MLITGVKLFSDFRRLWLGQTLSVFGSQLSSLAWPLTAVIVLNATPAQMGLLGLASTLPGLLVNLFAGVWVDRYPRQRILIWANLGLAAVTSSVPLAAFLGFLRLEYMYIAEFLIGTLSVFFVVAYHAYIPTLLKPEELISANSKLEGSNSVAAVAGPGLAGLLLQIMSAPFVLIFDALSFLACAGLISTIRQKETARTSAETSRNLWAEISYGLKLVTHNPLLRATMLCSGTYNLFGFFAFTAYTLYVVKNLEVPPAGLGVIYSLSSVGALLGAVIAGKFSQRYGVGAALVWSAFLAGLVFVIVPLVQGPLLVIIALLAFSRFVGSVGAVMYQVNQVSLQQVLTPINSQGRLHATSRFLVNGTIPLGSLLGGLSGELVGLQNTLIVGAIGTALSFFWLLFSPVRRLHSLQELETSPLRLEHN